MLLPIKDNIESIIWVIISFMPDNFNSALQILDSQTLKSLKRNTALNLFLFCGREEYF
jgi:hypothetical protein